MCTVTAVPRSGLALPAWTTDPLRLRVACNRDERLSRAEALAPAVLTLGGRRAIMPLDPESGGSWIAVNESGLVFVLLNSNRAGHAPVEGLSRGGLIPCLAGAASTSEALARLVDASPERHRPFRLLVLDGAQLVECWVEGCRLRYRRAHLQGAVMRTSSGLGDAVVEGPRRMLFRRFFRRASHLPAAQDAFHDHCWPGREDISVRMRRPDASTVSRTIVEVSAGFATMIYRATRRDLDARVVLPLAGTTAGARARCS